MARIGLYVLAYRQHVYMPYVGDMRAWYGFFSDGMAHFVRPIKCLFWNLLTSNCMVYNNYVAIIFGLYDFSDSRVLT